MNYNWFVGIDISKKTLDLVLYKKELQKKSPHYQVSNNSKGFRAIIKWLKEQKVTLQDTLFCMEHTSIYGVEIAGFLNNKANYCIESSLHIKRSLGLIRGKSDKIDAYQIARFCYLHREELKPAKLPTRSLVLLQSLFKERERLVKIRAIDKSIITELNYQPNRACIERTKNRLNFINTDIEQIESEIKKAISENMELERNYNLATSVTGIGLVNAVMFILFTNNFKSITEARKYACYSGVAPFEHTSGISIRGKTRTSKLSNKTIKVNLTNGAGRQ